MAEFARRRRAMLAATASAGAVAAWPAGGGAHVGGSGFILLLPTHLYVVGGAIVVAASFVLIALVPARLFVRAESLRVRLSHADWPGRRALSTGASLLSLAVVAALVVAGVRGSRDPLANPLPLFVWTVWWIGFTYLHAAFGDLWAHLNPWSGLYRVVTSAGLQQWRENPPLAYPERAGHWPAVAGFVPFAWFELIHPAPSDPAVLAAAVAGYVLTQFMGVFLFGERAVRAASDPFARGWDLIGTRDLHVVTSFLSDPARIYAIWHTQVALIVAAHVASVFVAHALALRVTGRTAAAAHSQLPLVLLMIGYTVLGLWLLSAPAVG